MDELPVTSLPRCFCHSRSLVYSAFPCIDLPLLIYMVFAYLTFLYIILVIVHPSGHMWHDALAMLLKMSGETRRQNSICLVGKYVWRACLAADLVLGAGEATRTVTQSSHQRAACPQTVSILLLAKWESD